MQPAGIMRSYQSILINIGPLNLLGITTCQNHGASQHIKVLLTKHRDANVTNYNRTPSTTTSSLVKDKRVQRQTSRDVSAPQGGQ